MNPCSVSTDKAHEQVQFEATAQTLHNQACPAEVVMDPNHQDAPTQNLPSLNCRRELQEMTQKMEELASENVSLREKMASKEQDWNEERRKILKALDGQKAWKNQMHELKVGFRNTLTNVRAEAEERRLVREKEVAAQLKALKDQCNQAAEEVLIKLSVERIALETQSSERLARLRKQEKQTVQSEAVWKTKLAALEDQLSLKDVELKRGLQREQQLQAEWFKKEEEWLAKINQMEEEMKLLENPYTEIQELAQTTEKEERKVKKEEKKAKKDAEKKLQKEKKEMEEREKKEKRENEKQEKERLKREKKEEEEKEKREKKEEEEKEKREKKEEEEKEKREKKEKKENEKQEKERLKREKKEEEEKEKREKKEKEENEKQEKERLKREKKEEEEKEKREKKEKEARDKKEKKEKKEKRRTA